MQTLRFVTALVCSATVTTAVAMPMAIKAMSYEAPAGLGAAVSSQGATASAEPAPLPPSTAGRIQQTPPSVVSAVVSTPAAPTTTGTTPPSTTAAPTPTTEPAVVDVAQEPTPPHEPTPTAPAPTAPPAAPATTAATTTTASPPNTGIGDLFDVTQPCGPNAHELDENQPGRCDPGAQGSG